MSSRYGFSQNDEGLAEIQRRKEEEAARAAVAVYLVAVAARWRSTVEDIVDDFCRAKGCWRRIPDQGTIEVRSTIGHLHPSNQHRIMGTKYSQNPTMWIYFSIEDGQDAIVIEGYFHEWYHDELLRVLGEVTGLKAVHKTRPSSYRSWSR